jgi:hypothetical protein
MGVNDCQLQRELGVACKTVRRMSRRIRIAMDNKDMRKAFGVFKENVKLDKNGAVIPSGKEPSKRGRGASKAPVVGVKERNSKNVCARLALPDSDGQKLTGSDFLKL